MKKQNLILFLFVLGISLVATSQTQTYQPDSATIYYDTSGPGTYYGGVWNFGCTYDSNGTLTHMRVGVIQDESCVIRNYDYQYDQDQHLTCFDYSAYDCDSPFGVVGQELSTYDHNLIISKAKYQLSNHKQCSGRQPWEMTDSTTYHYDSQGKLMLCESFNGNLVPTTSIHYEYGELEETVTTQQFESGTWMNKKRVSKTFLETDLLLSEKTENYVDGEFVNTSLVTYSYNGDNLLFNILTQSWEDGQWSNVKQLTYEYNSCGHITSTVLWQWQFDSFVHTNRANYEINEEGHPSKVYFEKWADDAWGEGTWQSDFNIFSESYLSRQNRALRGTNIKRIEIHYINTPMPSYDVNEFGLTQEFCKIFPNPATGFITIVGDGLKQVEVLDMLGQRVATHQAEGPQATIDISALPTGIYFVGITDENGKRCVRKVVKE